MKPRRKIPIYLPATLPRIQSRYEPETQPDFFDWLGYTIQSNYYASTGAKIL